MISQGQLIAVGRIDEIGGKDARMPLVRWRDENGPHEERTTEPAAAVSRLYARTGTEPLGLEVIRPSLEDIYLELVGSTTSVMELA